MPAIRVVVPTYQREASLELCLEALRNQSFQDFYVRVVDDGGTDDSKKVVLQSGLPAAYMRQEHAGFGAPRARNVGAKNCQSPLLVFVDSDIMLVPKALEVAWELYTENSMRAIGGYYKYLKGMLIKKSDVSLRWDDIWNAKLPALEINQGAVPIGKDVREYMNDHKRALGQDVVDVFDFEHEVCWSPFAFLSGVIAIPTEAFLETGGFAEFDTYGGEDAEMSLALITRGWPISYSRRFAGAHLAHPKNEGATGPNERARIREIAARYPDYLSPDGTPLEPWGKPVARK